MLRGAGAVQNGHAGVLDPKSAKKLAQTERGYI